MAAPPSPEVEPRPDPATLAPVTEVDLDWRSVLLVVALLVALALAIAAIRQAALGVTLVVVSLFVALALDPVVDRLTSVGIRGRCLSRGPAVLVVVMVLAAAFGAFGAIAGPQLASQTRTLGDQLPHTVDSLRDLPLLGPHLVEWGVPDKLTELLSSIPARIGAQETDVGGVAKGVGTGVGAFLLVLTCSVGALFEGPRLIDTIRGAVPADSRPAAVAIGRIVEAVIGRYFAGSLLVALLNGIWVSMWALIAGVPLSPVLGVWAAVTSMIPQIGGLLGFVVVAAVSLAAGVGPAIVMSVSFLAFMLFTNHYLQPAIVGRAVQLSAPVTMLAAITGFTVGGIVGALLAVPTVGAIKAVVHHLRNPDDSEPDDREPDDRNPDDREPDDRDQDGGVSPLGSGPVGP